MSIARRVRSRIGPGCAGMLMTVEEFDALPSHRWVAGYRYELINGVLVVCPPPDIGERGPNEELGYLLRLYQENDPRGIALDFTVSENDVPTTNRRRADRVIWAGLGRVPDPNADLPTIVIEFVSRRRRDWLRDYVAKRDEYLAAGVAEYWVIDRFRRTMTVYTPGPVERVIAEGEVYLTDRLPGFELPLARLLAVADRWRKR